MGGHVLYLSHIVLYSKAKTKPDICLLFPQVECAIFPQMQNQRLLLRSVKVDEPLVEEFIDKAMKIFKLNTVGPTRWAF